MITITRATVKDAAALAAIDAVSSSEPWSERSFAEALELPAYTFFRAEKEGNTVGYIGMMAVLDEADITGVAVLPAFRRRGIARRLLERLLVECEESGLVCLHLEVREGNHAARALYESMGFLVDGKRKQYYRFPVEDAVLMTWHRKESYEAKE